jgi:hypothetical protein
MANTEGMSDEVVEDLLWKTSATSTDGSSSRSRILQRMEMPIGEGGPAAKVLRASPKVKSSTKATKATKIMNPEERERDLSEERERRDFSSQPTTSHQQQQPHSEPENSLPAFELVGSIVEHVQTNVTSKFKSGTAAYTKGKSRFAQQAQTNNAKGFPSVHVPLGTFVKQKQKPTATNPASIADSSKTFTSSSSSSSPKTATSTTDSSTDSLLKASNLDADNLLAQMAPSEIQAQVKEIHEAISPELLSFLQKRGAKKKQNTKQKPTPTPTILLSSTPRTTRIETDERQEKERLADLVSSIQSYQDLDNAYAKEMQLEEEEQQEGKEENNKAPPEEDDFGLACNLLRSTSPRQTLWAARVVSQRLQQWVREKKSRRAAMSDDTPQPWPILLPVSLRCLLDQPHSVNGYILHTYVLQSLYALLCLGAHEDHVVLVGNSRNTTCIEIYQAVFLEDSIPTPALGACYPSMSAQPLEIDGSNASQDNKTPAVAYATSSSSTSAQTDGKAFNTDPMWSLLSRMRIVPRLAQLLLAPPTSSASLELPHEATIAICGILAMLGQRSPGAASAIVHHPILLPRLLDRTLRQQQVTEENAVSGHVEIRLAATVLLCTLARQSRVVAAALNVDELLPPLLAQIPTNELEFRLQQCVIYLWRTVLRYGLGLASLETVMNLAARSLTMSYTTTTSTTITTPKNYYASTEFVSALSVVLNCTRVAAQKTMEQLQGKLDQEQIQLLSLSFAWLSSTKQTVLAQLQPSRIDTNDDANNDNEKECFWLRWNTARLRFLVSFWNLSSDDSNVGNDEIKMEDASLDEQLSCLGTVFGWLGQGGEVERAWRRVSGFVTVTDFATDAPESRNHDLELEAASCAFLESLMSLLLTIKKSAHQGSDRQLRNSTKSVFVQVSALLMDGIQEAAAEARLPAQTKKEKSLPSAQGFPLAQRGWITSSHFAIARFLANAISSEDLISSSDVGLVRLLVFSLLGRLERGDESLAAVLFSQDILFRINGDPLEEPPPSSPISSMFLGEICGSDRARAQLDHSFKIHHGFGITSVGFGAFMLESLLSDAGQPVLQESPAELVLPIGTLWLWQTLSGVIQMKDEAVLTGTNEAASVVSACLSIVLELEQEEDPSSESRGGYAARIPLGAKLYYLLNVCLHPESILRDDRVLDAAEAVLNRYLPHMDKISVLEFAKACLRHTGRVKRKQTTSDEDKLGEKDKKLLSLFNPEAPNDAALSADEMRALVTFVEDLSSAYSEYGAQYGMFTKCIRLFLLPVFPTAIRCRMIQHIRDIHHLLTLPHELDDPSGSDIQMLLEQSISGGLPECDGSSRDSSDVLDMVASIIAEGGSSRPLEGFMLLYAISLLVRNLAMSLRPNSAGLDASKKRLLRLDTSIVAAVVETTAAFLVSDRTKGALAKTVMIQSCGFAPTEGVVLDDAGLDSMLTDLIQKTE